MAEREIKKVIILGHSGFIGRHLENSIRNQNPIVEIIGKSFPEVDLTKYSDALSLRPFFDMETAVIMCSAIKRENGDDLETFSKNLEMVKNICKLMETHPVKRFIFFSSAAVYGEDVENLNIKESTNVNPKSYYGIAKYCSEQLLSKTIAKNQESSLVMLRPPVVYGPGEQPRYGPSGFIISALKGQSIVLWGDGKEKREFIFVEDLVKLVHQLVFNAYGGIVNIASGRSYTFTEIIEMISSLTDINITVTSRERSKSKVDQQFCNDKIKSLFPAFSFTPLPEGLQKTIDYFRMQEMEEKQKSVCTDFDKDKSTSCWACNKDDVPVLLDFGMQPICNRFLRSAHQEEHKFILQMGLCKSCGLVQLVNPFPARELQPKFEWITYQEPEQHLDEVAEILSKLPNMNNKSRICGISFKDDTLLERLRKKGVEKVMRLDPKKDLGVENNQVGVETVQHVLTSERAEYITKEHGKFDLVVARHILEHTYNFKQFIDGLKKLLNPGGRILLEVPDCTKALDLFDYSTVWEEHLVYFTPYTLQKCLSLATLSLEGFEIFPYLSENCLVAIVKPEESVNAQAAQTNVKIKQTEFQTEIQPEINRAVAFADQFRSRKEELQGFLGEFSNNRGKISFFGAGHLTAVFINIFDLTKYVPYVIDDNPHKLGLLMPGSKIPIVGSSALVHEHLKLSVFGLNPGIEDKIIAKNKLFTESGGSFLSICPASEHSLDKELETEFKRSNESRSTESKKGDKRANCVDPTLKKNYTNNQAMKFLIIGASGFLGKYTYDHIKSLGYTVLGTESKPRNPEFMPFDLEKDRIQEQVGADFFKGEEPVFCIIPAFISQIDTCFREKETSYKVNVTKIIQLLQDLKGLNVKPVFISSSFVFDGEKGNYTEEDLPNPICEYGRHKAEVEEYIRENIPEALVLRLDKMVGSSPQEKHMFSEWYSWAQENKPITCIAGQVFSPTYVKDIAKAVFLLCQKNCHGIYHVANNEFFSRKELARQFLTFFDKKVEVVEKSQKELGFLDFRPLKTNLDSTKLNKTINLKFTPLGEVFRIFREELESEKK